MRVLALDTTTRRGSVAIVEDDEILEELSGEDQRTHAERLPREILALLDTRGLTIAEIDLFAVASGPGSFTGLRIGIATMQGLAFARGRQMAGVSALEALGQLGSRGRSPGSRVAAWIDARRRDVFAALYEVTDAALFSPERLREIEGPTVGDPRATLARWSSALDVVVGDGAVLYRETLADAAPDARILGAPLLAGAIGRIAAVRSRRGDTVGAAGIQPLYVRRPDAEVARDGGRNSGARESGSRESTVCDSGAGDVARDRAPMMMTGRGAAWRVEPLTSPDEIDTVLEIEKASFTNPWTREMYLSELANRGTSYCFLARLGSSRVAGFCSFWLVLDEVHINNLAVLPEMRRRGAASALLEHVLIHGARLGAKRATLEVRRSNNAARVLYERFGFRVAGVRRAYYTNPVEDALILCREGLRNNGPS